MNLDLIDDSCTHQYFYSNQGWPGPELKDFERKKLTKDVDFFIQKGGCIKNLSPQKKAIKALIKKRGGRGYPRERHAKLNIQTVKEIKTILAAKSVINNFVFEWLASEYGVSSSTIRYIYQDRIWKYVGI